MIDVGGPTSLEYNLALAACRPKLTGVGDPKQQICYQTLAA
jgi:hypothetical protein